VTRCFRREVQSLLAYDGMGLRHRARDALFSRKDEEGMGPTRWARPAAEPAARLPRGRARPSGVPKNTVPDADF